MEQKGQRDMLIFDELWNGAFSPCEHRYERNSDYDVVSRRISAQMDVLRQNASKRQKKVWDIVAQLSRQKSKIFIMN